MNLAIQKYYKDSNTFNTLFLPGLPRPYIERPLTADLELFGSNMYTVVYPGTHSVPGEVSPSSLVQAVQGAITELNKTGLPLLLIAYSFSTGYVLEAAKVVEKPLGFIFFSPTIDLKHDSRDDFYRVTARLNQSSDINVNAEKFSFAPTWEVSIQSYFQKLDELTRLNVPVVFISGEKDPALKSEMIVRALGDYKENQDHDLVDVMCLPAAGHNLDELYEFSEVKKRIQSILAR